MNVIHIIKFIGMYFSRLLKQTRLGKGKHDDTQTAGMYCAINSFITENNPEQNYPLMNVDDPRERFRCGKYLRRQGLLEEAAQEFLAVIKLYGCSAGAHFNMGAIRFQQYRYEEAIRHYKEGLKLMPQQASAHADLGKIYEMVGQWDKALCHLNVALKLEPTHLPARRRQCRILEERQIYETLGTQLEVELEASPFLKNPGANNLPHFTVTYDERVPNAVRIPISHLLELAYWELGDIFDCYPKQQTAVSICYDSQLEYMSSPLPQWAAGRYDGRIILMWRAQQRLNISLLYVVLRHEYVHLLVDILKAARCPAWLNEGLAEYTARGLLNTERETLRRAVTCKHHIPLKQLEQNFNSLDTKQIRLAYIQSCSAVEYMVENYGMSAVKKLLSAFEKSKSLNESFISVLKTTPGEFEKQWLFWVTGIQNSEFGIRN